MSARESLPGANQAGGHDGGRSERKGSPPREKKTDTLLSTHPADTHGSQRSYAATGLSIKIYAEPVINHEIL